MSAARDSSLAAYAGEFGRAQAERLLWRAGFGPRPGEAERLAGLGVEGAVRSLTRPGAERLTGPAPRDGKGRPLAPADAWGHDHLWWLDRMVRSNRPLVERMTLVWHDWFATSRDGVSSQRLMLRQNALFRRFALGSFEKLLLGVTQDPAMLLWLNGSDNSKWSPNENYARELMELFTLGAGRGYRESDVREQARALTGFRNDWDDNVGPVRFRYEGERHDPGAKRVFGKRGNYTWEDACALCLHHRSHPSFFVTKLWSYFVPTPAPAATQRALEVLYRKTFAVRPVVEAILRHPLLYDGPRMVKPPAVFQAGMLRALGRGVDTDAWAWLGALAGQQLFYPPNVAGWDDGRWLDTATFNARWDSVTYALRPEALDPRKTASPFDAEQLLARATAFWGDVQLAPQTRDALLVTARQALADANERWKRKEYPVLLENALRQLVAMSPEMQTS